MIAETQFAPTPIAQALAASGAPLTEFRGVLTVAAFASEAAETAAALDSAVVHDLGWQQRVAVTGEDRMRWLNGMVTNNVAGLSAQAPDTPIAGTGNYNFILNAQGRIQGDCRLWRMQCDGQDQLELELAANQFARLMAHLEHFIIMDDVELTPLAGWTALGLTGPKAATVLQSATVLPSAGPNPSDSAAIPPGTAQLAHLRATPASPTPGSATPASQAIRVLIRRQIGRQANHFALWCRDQDASAAWLALQSAGATAIGAETIERLRIIEGIPAFGVDFADSTLPQEAGIDEALHFTKGCYLGQEIVERIRSRGQVHRQLRALELFPAQQPPTPGQELSGADQKPAGKLTSVTHIQRNGATRWFALAMLRTTAAVGEWTYPGGKAQMRTPTRLTTTL
jgi:aminomethyltransferase